MQPFGARFPAPHNVADLHGPVDRKVLRGNVVGRGAPTGPERLRFPNSIAAKQKDRPPGRSGHPPLPRQF